MVKKVNKKRLTEKINVEASDVEMLYRHIELLWNFLPIPIFDINSALVIINAGKKFFEFFGYEPGEIIGEEIKKIFPTQGEFEKFKKELLEKRGISQKEFEVLTKKGERIPVLVFATPREEEGVLLGYFVAFIDLREIKEKERELREKIEELENFERLAVGRELKMVELKQKIEELEKKMEK